MFTAVLRRLKFALRADSEGGLAIRNACWLLLEKFCRLFLGLVVGAWVARYLGPERFGVLAYVLAYLALFQVAATLGIDGIAVREISRDRSQANEILGTLFVLKAIAGVVAVAIALSGAATISSSADGRFELTALVALAMLMQPAESIDVWFQSQSMSRYVVAAKLPGYVITNLLRVLLILVGAPLMAFAAMMVVESMLSAVGLVATYLRQGGPIPWSPSAAAARRLCLEGWPLLLSGLSVTIYARIDQIMIENMLGPEKLGIYAAVLPLATTWQFIPMTLAASLAPMLARRKAADEATYLATLATIFQYFGAIGWAVSLAIAIGASWVVPRLYGPAYAEAGPVLSIHGFTNVFLNLGVAQSLWAINEGRAMSFLQKTLLGAAVSVVGNIILIPRFGLQGVACVAVASQFVAAVLSNVLISQNVLRLQLRALIPLRLFQRRL